MLRLRLFVQSYWVSTPASSSVCLLAGRRRCVETETVCPELLGVYVSLFQSVPAGWETTLARALRVVVEGACSQSDVRATGVLAMLQEYFTGNR